MAHPSALSAVVRGLLKAVDGDEEAAWGVVRHAAVGAIDIEDVVRACLAFAKRVVAVTTTASVSAEEGTEWNVRAVLCGDGSVGRSGLQLADGVMYASSSMRGGHESFWEIDSSTLRVCNQGASVLLWPVAAISAKARRANRSPRGPVVDMEGMRELDARLAVSRELVRWCKENRGVAVLIGGPGYRDVSERTRMYRVQSFGRVAWTFPAGRCVDGSIALAVWRVLGEQQGHLAFREMLKRTERTGITSLKRVRELLHALPVNLETQCLSKEDTPALRANAFRWFAEEAKGVWIVRLVQSNVVDHCVVIDANEALIFDVAEEFPLMLTEESLQLCGGDDANRLKFAEARQIVEQVRKAKRTRR